MVVAEIVAGVAIGAKLGDHAQKLIINYTRDQYDGKIDQLMDCIKQLNTALTSLQTKQSEVKNFWSDDNARRMTAQLEKQIHRVQISLTRAENLKQIYQDTMEELDMQKTRTSGALDTLESLLGNLSIGKE